MSHTVASFDELQRDRFTQRPTQQLFHAQDQPIRMHGARIERLPSRECEQTMRQCRRSIRSGHRGRHISIHIDLLTARELSLHHVERADDAGQQIVEIVRDAAGELADRFHLLRLTQRLFRFGQSFLIAQALGDVLRILKRADHVVPTDRATRCM